MPQRLAVLSLETKVTFAISFVLATLLFINLLFTLKINFNARRLLLIGIFLAPFLIVAVIYREEMILLGLQNKGYQALFLQGGASLEFIMVAFNLLENNENLQVKT